MMFTGNISYIHRGIAIVVAVLLCIPFASARKVVQTSDKLCPRWYGHIDEIGRYRNPVTKQYTYDYECVQSVGMDINALKVNRELALKNHFKQEFKIDGDAITEYTHSNEQGKIYDTDTYKITFHTKTSVQAFVCRFIDEYWERFDDGEYRLYTLFAVSIPGIEPHFDSYIPVTDYALTEGLVRSLIPGWGQIYKGSKVKGGLIIAGEAIGVGGIITCYSMKSSYEKLMREDPEHLKEYSMSADMWQNIGYGCIAFTAAVYIYNLIDAAVASGARRIRVYPRDQPIQISPIAAMDGSIGIAMKYNF